MTPMLYEIMTALWALCIFYNKVCIFIKTLFVLVCKKPVNWVEIGLYFPLIRL